MADFFVSSIVFDNNSGIVANPSAQSGEVYLSNDHLNIATSSNTYAKITNELDLIYVSGGLQQQINTFAQTSGAIYDIIGNSGIIATEWPVGPINIAPDDSILATVNYLNITSGIISEKLISSGQLLLQNDLNISGYLQSKISDHNNLDTLVHNLSEARLEELVESGNITYFINWTDQNKILKIREEIYTKDINNKVIIEEHKQYDSSGNIIEYISGDIIRVNNKYSYTLWNKII